MQTLCFAPRRGAVTASVGGEECGGGKLGGIWYTAVRECGRSAGWHERHEQVACLFVCPSKKGTLGPRNGAIPGMLVLATQNVVPVAAL